MRQRRLIGWWLFGLAVLAPLALAGRVTAKEPARFDPAARAKFIARYLAPDAALVGHADMSRVKVDALFADLARLVPADPQQLEFTRTAVEESVEMFLKAGGRDAFVVLGAGGEPLLIVPVAPDADEAAILAILGQAPFETTEKLAGAIVAGSEAAVARVRDSKGEPRPELAKGFAAAGDTAAQVLLVPTEDNRKVVEQLLPNLPPELGGASTRPVSRGLNWLALGVEAPPKLAPRLVADASDAKAAGELSGLLSGVIDALLKQPDFARLFPDAAGLRKLLAPKTNQNQVVLELAGQPLLDQLKQPVDRARGAAKRVQSINNLKQLALAMHNYHDTNGAFPAAVHAKNGKPLLSWRVLVLPYLEEAPLFEQFHLDEPWDSEHNRKLIPRMPTVLRSPLSQAAEPGRTVYLTPRGADSAFPGQTGVKLREITDGTSNTIMLIEADDEHAVPWTKPDDWEYDPREITKGLRLLPDGGYLVGFADGSVQMLSKDIKPATLKLLLTRAGGEVVPQER